MIAFFGLGMQEILLLAVLAAMGVGAAVVILIVIKLSSGRSSEREAALEEENRQLRSELDRESDRPR
jgi:hypothetical protein